jgi:hypothetical protein
MTLARRSRSRAYAKSIGTVAATACSADRRGSQDKRRERETELDDAQLETGRPSGTLGRPRNLFTLTMGWRYLDATEGCS